MSSRYRGGQLPAAEAPGRLRTIATAAVAEYRNAMERLMLHEGVAAAFRIIDATNLFIADTQPWALARQDADSARLTGVLAEAAEAVRIAAVLLSPVMPASTAEILRRMGETRPAKEIRLDDADWRASGEKHVLNEGPLWPRKEAMSETPNPSTPAVQSGATTPTPESPTAPLTQAAAPTPATSPENIPLDNRISIEDFMKVELRTAKIVEAERVPKSKKLMKMRIDVGAEQRTIVAGIAEAYEPDALVGRTVVIVANLKPAKLMGIESNGMVLAASPDGGQPMLLSAEPAEPGTRVR
jgi:methionyl-tRNA synthetase